MGQGPDYQRLELIDAYLFDDDPQQVARVRRSPVLEAFLGEILVDGGAVLVVLKTRVCLRHDALAGAADGHDLQPDPLGEGEVAGVERVAKTLVLLLEDTRAGARRAVCMMSNRSSSMPSLRQTSSVASYSSGAGSARDAAWIEGVSHSSVRSFSRGSQVDNGFVGNKIVVNYCSLVVLAAFNFVEDALYVFDVGYASCVMSGGILPAFMARRPTGTSFSISLTLVMP